MFFIPWEAAHTRLPSSSQFQVSFAQQSSSHLRVELPGPGEGEKTEPLLGTQPHCCTGCS